MEISRALKGMFFGVTMIQQFVHNLLLIWFFQELALWFGVVGGVLLEKIKI